MNKKLIKYGLLGLAGAAAIYLLAVALFKKDDGNGGDEEEEGEAPADEQTIPDANLTAAIKNGTAKGKKIYTKVDKVNIRYSPAVNNGMMDNIWTQVATKGTYLGTIFYVFKSTDTTIINPATGQPYYWLVINLDADAWKTLNDELGWYDPDKQRNKWVACDPTTTSCRNNYWVREDTVRL